jgi:hypothetical protein
MRAKNSVIIEWKRPRPAGMNQERKHFLAREKREELIGKVTRNLLGAARPVVEKALSRTDQ